MRTFLFEYQVPDISSWGPDVDVAPPFSSSSELFTTEVSHLRTLRVLDQVFFQKMRSVLNSDELACIFPNLPQVYELHGQCVCVCELLFVCIYYKLHVFFH